MSGRTLSEVFSDAVEASGAGRLDEAEAGFRAVLEHLPDHGESLFGLGLTLMNGRRFSEAVEPLARAARASDSEPVRWIVLGQVLYMAGLFGEAAEAFATADRQETLPPNARLTWARAAAYHALDSRSADEALSLYSALTGEAAEDLKAVARDGFAVFTAFGRLRAARTIGAWLVERAPDDEVLKYELQVLGDADLDRAPEAYVEALFNGFAETFDQQLVDMLGYQAPALLADLVAAQRKAFDAVLDLGCGTGLSAPALERFGGALTGVDLSAGMLAKAAERGAYDQLVRAEAVAFLRDHSGAYDLIFATDVLIYIGNVEALFAATAAALKPGGMFAFSTEMTETGWRVLPSGRFAQADAYIRAVAAPCFEVLTDKEIPLRREADGEIRGCLYVLRKKPEA